MALHVGSPKDTTRELLELISALGTVAGYKLMPRNLPHVYTLATKGQKGRGGGDNQTYQCIQKNKTPMNKPT